MMPSQTRMFEIPEARPSRMYHENATITSDRLSAESTTTRRMTCGRRRIRVRKYVNGNAIVMHTSPASRQIHIEKSARSRNTGWKRRCQLASSKAGV